MAQSSWFLKRPGIQTDFPRTRPPVSKRVKKMLCVCCISSLQVCRLSCSLVCALFAIITVVFLVTPDQNHIFFPQSKSLCFSHRRFREIKPTAPFKSAKHAARRKRNWSDSSDCSFCQRRCFTVSIQEDNEWSRHTGPCITGGLSVHCQWNKSDWVWSIPGRRCDNVEF